MWLPLNSLSINIVLGIIHVNHSYCIQTKIIIIAAVLKNVCFIVSKSGIGEHTYTSAHAYISLYGFFLYILYYELRYIKIFYTYCSTVIIYSTKCTVLKGFYILYIWISNHNIVQYNYWIKIYLIYDVILSTSQGV